MGERPYVAGSLSENQKQCDRRYVSWVWLAGILMLLIGSVVMAAWNTRGWTEKTETRIERLEESQAAIRRVEAKVDTLLERSGLRRGVW